MKLEKIKNYYEACIYFQNQFPKATFKLTENTIFGNVNNVNVEEIWKALKNNNNETTFETHPTKIQ